MKLTNEERERKLRGDLANSFISSDFYKKYFYPELERLVAVDFPSPDKVGWEDLGYRKSS